MADLTIYKIGEVMKGYGNGLNLYVGKNGPMPKLLGITLGAEKLLEKTDLIEVLAFGKNKSLLSPKVETTYVIDIDDVETVKKVNEMNNDFYYQLTYKNGETSLVKIASVLPLKYGTYYPAQVFSELFITKFVQ